MSPSATVSTSRPSAAKICTVTRPGWESVKCTLSRLRNGFGALFVTSTRPSPTGTPVVATSSAGIAIALVTGDQNAVDKDDADAMRRSGLTHLLSVSGLHIAAVVAFAMLLSLKLLA